MSDCHSQPGACDTPLSCVKACGVPAVAQVWPIPLGHIPVHSLPLRCVPESDPFTALAKLPHFLTQKSGVILNHQPTPNSLSSPGKEFGHHELQTGRQPLFEQSDRSFPDPQRQLGHNRTQELSSVEKEAEPRSRGPSFCMYTITLEHSILAFPVEEGVQDCFGRSCILRFPCPLEFESSGSEQVIIVQVLKPTVSRSVPLCTPKLPWKK